MNEQEIGNKIKGYLDDGAAGLKAGTAFRLQRARQLALSRLSELEHAEELVLAHPGGGLFGARRLLSHGRLLIGVLLIVGAVVGYQYWQTAQQAAVQQAAEIEETDAAILSSDLPIEAYLDQGFQAWLKHPEP